jgi:hypothetical protein
MQIMWSGNATIRTEEKEATYVLESIGIEHLEKDVLALKIAAKADKAVVEIPLSKQDCKKLVTELINNL